MKTDAFGRNIAGYENESAKIVMNIVNPNTMNANNNTSSIVLLPKPLVYYIDCEHYWTRVEYFVDLLT